MEKNGHLEKYLYEGETLRTCRVYQKIAKTG